MTTLLVEVLEVRFIICIFSFVRSGALDFDPLGRQ